MPLQPQVFGDLLLGIVPAKVSLAFHVSAPKNRPKSSLVRLAQTLQTAVWYSALTSGV
jgi:hypothetical protein